MNSRSRASAAAPAILPCAAQPGGWRKTAYYRLHGSPRMYFSAYADDEIERLAAQLKAAAAQPSTGAVYCIFDNTGLGAAGVNALTLRKLTSSLTATR